MRNEELILVLKKMSNNTRYSNMLQRWIYIKNNLNESPSNIWQNYYFIR